MKTVTAFLLFSFFCFQSIAQNNWSPLQSEWYYNYNNFVINGYVHFACTKDTVYNSIPCRKIERQRAGYINGTHQLYYENYSPLYTYDDNGIIYMTDEHNEFDTLYNFNAALGDKWQALKSPHVWLCDSDSYFLVEDTGHVILQSENLKWLSVQFISGSNSVLIADTIFEKVGTTHLYMLPHDFCNGMIDGQEGGSFRCYTDSNLSFKRFEICDTVYGYDAVTDLMKEYISVFPNPASDVLNISTGSNYADFDIVITNCLGQIVSTNHYPAAKNIAINIASIPEGIYSLQLIEKGKPGISKNLIITK
jgi:hypothetical protein